MVYPPEAGNLYLTIFAEGNMMHARRQVKTIVDKENLILFAEVKSVEQLQIDSIELIIAENIFTKVFFSKNKSIQVRKALKEWESFLPGKNFIRINRAAIINLQHVRLIEKSAGNTMKIYMQNYEEPVIMSRSYVTKLKGKLII